MPLTIDRPPISSHPRISDIRERRKKRGAIRDRGRHITIGLVNNMPDSALVATERQFSRLIEAASGDADIRLRFYSLPQIPRSREAMNHLNQLYADATGLRGQKLDALIVTGAQPIAPDLKAEPYWDALTRVIDWAEANTISTILSCLAAHVGVLHLNGLARRPLETKCSGVYAFDIVRSDPLTDGVEGRWLTPHSRYNGLDEKELAWNDYKILTASPDAGVDIFTKQLRSLLVFLQGHPEYESETLAREYRRDMNRHFNGELLRPPRLPEGYFSADAARAWLDVQEQAERGERIDSFPEIRGTDAHWRPFADLFYRNWLTLIAERKARTSQDSSPLVARWGG
jgi:homoserine O-succinyltransferase/O-acetyltransferase